VNADAARSAADLIAVIGSGEMSATEAVAAQLEALHRVHAQTNAVVWFEDARALADAAALDQAFANGGAVGPLHGLPVTIKDWIDVEGFPCAGESGDGSRRPDADATVVRRLRQAGAVIVGKSRVWGRSRPAGRVTHPVDPARSVGGSSSGEAVAVATGASPLGIGSDSGGSIRLPAAWCGVLGFKPTAGRVPLTGHYPRIGALSDGRTQIGPLGRTVADLELALAVIAGPDWRDAGVAPVPLLPASQAHLRGIRFAILTGEDDRTVQSEIATAVERAAAGLEDRGATRSAWPLTRWLADALDITQRYWRRNELTGADAERQLWDWDRYRHRYLEAAEQIDLLITPTTPHTAPLDRPISPEDFIWTLPASLTGSPALAIPSGTDHSGLPVSIQLIGRPWEDHRVLAAARLIAEPTTS
jgi:amidase